MTTFFCVITFVLVAFTPFFVEGAVKKILNKYRRKKHPKYFEYYDEATKLKVAATAEMDRMLDWFTFRVSILTEGLNEGECTKDYFKQSFDAITDRYIDASSRFTEQCKKSDELFKQADLYAREHMLNWGVLWK